MKKALLFLLCALLFVEAAALSAAAILSPGISVLAEAQEVIVSAQRNTPVHFTSEDFCRGAGVDSYEVLTVTALPPESEGTLYYNGVAAAVNQRISFENTGRLTFSPSDDTVQSSFDFALDSQYALSCTVRITENVNFSPEAVSSRTAFDTLSGSAFAGQLIAHDPEGDSIVYEITRQPVRGEVDCDASTGHFVYTPASSGSDSFGFCARDKYGNYSEEAQVEFSVRGGTDIVFADMENSDAHAAAVLLSEKGLMTYSEQDGELYFEPGAQVSRLDFLICAMNVLGAENVPTVSSTGFTDDEDIPDEYKGYVYSARTLGIVSGIDDGGKLYFRPQRTITRGEAAVILNNIIGHTGAASYSFPDPVPQWAAEDVCAMYELGVYTLPSGRADTGAPVTRDYEAQLLHRLRCLVF